MPGAESGGGYLLFVCHSPSANTVRLRDVAAAAMHDAAGGELDIRVRAPLAADAADVRGSAGVLIGSTENFGDMAGLSKDFFERIYYPCLEHTHGLPVALYVRAGQDGRGAVERIGRITTGLGWRYVAEPLVLRGKFSAEFDARVAELAGTLAAGVAAGIF